MFNAKEVAKTLGISEQAVYKKFRNLDSIQEFITIVDGVKCIDKEGLNLLKNTKFKGLETKFKSLETECAATEEENLHQEQEKFDITDKIKELYEKILSANESEIKNLREENKRLLEIIAQQNKLLLNQQVLQEKVLSTTELMLLEKRKVLEERQEKFKEEKISWFSKIFSKN